MSTTKNLIVGATAFVAVGCSEKKTSDPAVKVGDNWKELIMSFCNLGQANGPESLFLGSSVSNAALDTLASDVGFVFPEEFRDLYAIYDGFGIELKADTRNSIFMPVSEIPQFAKRMQGWFEETHAKVASRFISFINWNNGNSSGYLFSETGQLEGIYTLQHDEYNFEEDQDWREFLVPAAESIKDLLLTQRYDENNES